MALPCAILDEAQVARIKAAIWRGDMQEEIAAKYGVNHRSISNIKRGATWPDVPWPNKKAGAIDPKRALEITRDRMRARSVSVNGAKTSATESTAATSSTRKKGK